MDYLDRYLQWQRQWLAGRGIERLNIAIDCSNGMASLLAAKLYPNAKLINAELDGSFACHSPNPLAAASREQLVKMVVDGGFDCGVIFDGDADRAMFVDEKGDFVQSDYLVPIIAKALHEQGRVIHDVRTSRGAIEAIRELGCEPVMVPVGHAFAKPILRKVGAFCGGELAGHYYFRDFHGCDSGLLAATLILGEIAAAKAEGISFSQLMRPIVTRYANSGELNFRVEDKDAAIERALAVAAKTLPPEIGRETMDGLRIEYAEGWLNLRKSNTEPFLRLIVECDTTDRLNDWIRLLSNAINA